MTMGLFAVNSKGSSDWQRMLVASSAKKKKKKRGGSRQQLIQHERSSSATQDDDCLSGESVNSSVTETNNYRLKIKKTTATTPNRTSFRKLEEFEYEGAALDPQDGANYIPPPDFNPLFGITVEDGAFNEKSHHKVSTPLCFDKMSTKKKGLSHLKADCATFERFESRSSDGEDFSSRHHRHHQPSQQPTTTKIHKSKTAINSTPLRNNSIKTNGKIRNMTSGKKKNALVSSSGKNKNKTAAFHLSSDYLPSKISPRKVKSRNRKLELVGSTDSLSFCEYEPPPFLPEHRQVLSPKATFHFEPEPLMDESKQKDENGAKEDEETKEKQTVESFVSNKTNTGKKPKKKIANGKGYHEETVVPEIETHSSGEETFDVRSWNSSPLGRKDAFVEEGSPSPRSIATEASSVVSPKGSDSTFRQIVFNDSLDKIEQVAVAKSDNGASDFSDFVKAAAQLTKSFSKDFHTKCSATDGNKRSMDRSPAKAKAALAAKNKSKKWPALKDNKGKDTPSNFSQQQQQCTTSNVSQQKNQPVLQTGKSVVSNDEAPFLAPRSASKSVASKESIKSGPDSDAKSVSSKKDAKAKFVPISSGVKPPEPTNDEIPFVAPSSLPSCRMKLYKGLAELSVTETTKDGSDGFTISSTSSSLPSKNRQMLREAIRSKPKTPLEQRSEARSEKKSVQLPPSPGELKSVDTGSMMGDCSVSHESFSKFPAIDDPFQSSEENAKEVEDDPFQILDTRIPDGDPFVSDPFHVAEQDSTFWVPTDDPFLRQKPKASQPTAKQNAAVANKSKVLQSASMDDGLIASIRKASTKATDPEIDSRKRDPSPTIVRPSNSDGNIPYSSIKNKKEYRSMRTVEPRLASPDINVRKVGSSTKPSMALPANAILGSMLFRQTLATQFMESSSATKKQQHQEKSSLPFEELKQNKGSKRKASKSRHHNEDHSYHVPHSVDTNDGDQSTVSSVTEEASSFYERSHVVSSSAKWNRQVQNMLNQFNTRQNLQARVNSLIGHNDTSAKQRPQTLEQQDTIKPSLSRSEEEHVSMFRSDE